MGKTPAGGGAAAEQDHYLVPGLVRGLEALQAFTPERQRLSLGEMAQVLGITRSACFRVAYTLAQLGFLLHDPLSRTFTPGPAVLRLGYGYLASPRELLQAALPHLEALHEACGWSVHLGVLDGRDVVYLLRLAATRGVSSIVHVGTRLPAHATSMGRVLLAGLPEAQVTALYRGEHLAGLRGRSPVTLAALLRRRREDAARAVVTQDGGFEPGIASVAAAVRDASGTVVAAINASTASTAVDGAGEMDRVAGLVSEAAGLLCRTLGPTGQERP